MVLIAHDLMGGPLDHLLRCRDFGDFSLLSQQPVSFCFPPREHHCLAQQPVLKLATIHSPSIAVWRTCPSLFG